MNNIFRIKKEERLFALITLIVIIAFNVLMITYHLMISASRKQDSGRSSPRTFRFQVSTPTPTLPSRSGRCITRSIAIPCSLSSSILLATERLADRTHLPQLGNYHRGGDDDILLHLLHPLLQKNLQRGDAAEGYRQQCAHSDAFSFAYVLLVTFVDDHFGMSLFFLSMTLYLAGKQQQEHRSMPWWQTALLFFFTAGITLSNGAKTFLAALFTNGKNSSARNIWHWASSCLPF